MTTETKNGASSFARMIACYATVVAIAGILTGWGITIGSWKERLHRGEQAYEKLHELELTVATMQRDISRLPVIESKLDKLLSAQAHSK